MSNRKSRFCIAVLVIVMAVVLAFTVIACKKSGATDKSGTGGNNQNGPVSDDYESEEVSKTEWDQAFAAVYSAKANASNFTGKVSACAEAKGDGARGKETYDITVKIADGKISYKEAFAAGDYSDEYETYYEYVAAESAWYEYSYDDEADGWAKEKSSAYTSSSTIADFGSVANFLEENGLSDYADYTFNSSKGRYEAAVEDKEGATYTVYLKFKDTSLVYAYIEFESDEYSGNYEIFWYDYGATKVTLPTIGEPEAPATYYTVTFNTQGGSAMASVEVEEGAVIGDVTLPTKQCAELVGFAKDANGKETWDLNSDTVTGNITLYAIWEDAHTWGAWKTVSEPTCTAEGLRKHECAVCGDDETESIPALGHDFEEEYTVDVAPGCLTKGSESRHCTRCDVTTDSREIEALGHDFEEEYTVDVAPGCFTKGSESRHCTRCDATTDSREVEALGHDFKEWAYDDTEHWKICSRCGTISEKTGHVYQESGKCECGATEITPGSEFTFNDLGEGTYSLAGYSGTRENIRIPATYNGGSVVSIESSAFVDCTGITSVIVPDSVTSIGEGAFSGCGSLESITIPFVGAEAGKTSSDTYQYPFGYIFGTDSYAGGTEVTQYYYGSSTSYTTSSTYYIPASLRSVTVTGGNILYGAFRNCSMLTSVTIGNSVTSIGGYAFEDCTGLTSVYYTGDIAGWCGIWFGNGSANPLYYAGNLYIDGQLVTDLVIPDSVTAIKSNAFYGCTGLTSVYYTGDIADWCGISFGNEYANPLRYAGDLYIDGQLVTDLVIPDSVTRINADAFYGCTGLTSVVIPDSVTSIGSYAFYNCTGLTAVYYTGDIAGWCGISFGNENANPIRYAGELYIDGQLVTDLVIPDSVTEIKDYAFYGYTGLTSVTIGTSVTSIGDYAFRNCKGLTTVTIGTSVTSIGGVAFWFCYKLVEVYNKSSLNITAGSSSYGYVGCYAKNVYTEENGSWFTDTAEGYRFFYDETTGYLVGYYGEATDITLPDSFTAYDGTTVNSYEIYKYAFYGNTSLTSVVIPDSVTSIGSYAFSGCTAEIIWGDNPAITVIGEHAFSGYGGDSIVIPDSVTSIGEGAFSGCKGLTEINWNAVSVTDFDYNSDVFYNAGTAGEGIAVTFGESVEKIPAYAFYWCRGLTSVTIIGAGVTSIGERAFYKCTGLTSVTIGDGVTSIGRSAFSGCTGLTSVTIGNSVKSIGDYAFEDCTGLTSVTIPDSVTSIGRYAFNDCTAEIIWGDNPANTVIGEYAFAGYGGDSIVIPDSVTSIGRFAFSVCTGLTSVIIPDSVTSIGEYAFDDCTGLTSVTIGDGVTSIGDCAFRRCTGLTSVTIPDSVTSIGSYAFSNCTGLTSVTIGKSVESISSAFEYCYKLVEVYNKSSLDITAGRWHEGDVGYYAKNVYTEENGSWFTDTADGYRFLYDGTKGYLIGYYGEATDITLPDSFTAYDGTTVNSYEIYQYAFYGNIALTSVVIPDFVTSISDDTFYNCRGLTSVTIPDSVTSIGDGAFSGCTGLTSITIPDSVTSIGDYAFCDCTGLTSITIPDGVTSIGDGAFSDCTGLTEINWNAVSVADFNSNSEVFYYAGTAGEGIAVTFGDGVEKIPAYLFYVSNSSYRPNIKTVIIGSDVTSIGKSAFSGCTGLTSIYYIGDIAGWLGISGLDEVMSKGGMLYIDGSKVEGEIAIPDGVTSIPSYAFAYQAGITSVTIPDSVTSIGDYAFSDCTGLTSITIPDGVTSIGERAFHGTAWLNNQPNGLVYIGKVAYKYNGTMPSNTEIIIKDGTTGIGYEAFYGCTGLTSITIPDGVTNIGDLAFYNCTGLTEINWNAVSVADFGYNSEVFYYAGTAGDGIAVTFGDGVEKIPAYLFYVSDSSSRPNIKSVTIGNAVKNIGDLAFSGCTSLTSIYYTGDIAGWLGISGLGSVMSGGRTLYIDGSKVEGAVTIPDGVTSIPSYAFRYQTGITSITIPDSVTSIGDDAFSGCTGLTSVTIPDGVTSIGESAFSGCTGLTEINWNAVSVADFNSYVFFNAGTAGEGIAVTFGESVEKIPAYAFSGCTGLTSVTMGDGVTSIGEYAFSVCKGLTSVTIGGGVTSIGERAFSGCTGLTSVTIPDGVTSIGDYAFSGCTGLTEINWNAVSLAYAFQPSQGVFYNAGTAGEGIAVTFGESIERIPAYLFYVEYSSSRPNIKSVIIGANVTIIGSFAFYGCTGLTSVTIGDGVTSIGESAFSGCTGLTSVAIPDSVTIIWPYAFLGCTGLTSITIPDSVKELGYGAFEDCTGLTEINWNAVSLDYGFQSSLGVFYNAGTAGEGIAVTFGESVREIPSHTFRACHGLTSVTMGDGVTSIGNSAFSGCTGLTSITIPDSVTSIGESAFSGCTGLTEINWNAVSVANFNSSSGVFRYAGTADNGIAVTFGESVQKIPAYALDDCDGLTSITIGAGVTSIGDYAFNWCTGLTEINWNAVSVADFDSDSNVFYFAGTAGEGIAVTFGESVQKIPAYALDGCDGLTSITIGTGVTSIGDSAFYDCTGVYYTGDMTSWLGKTWHSKVMASGHTLYIDGSKVEGAIAIPDGVGTIPSYAFAYQTGITSVTIPDSVTSIGSSAFRDCTGLTSVTIPNSVTSIGSSAFSGCTGLTSAVIPDSVTSIGDWAFNNCTGLTSVVFEDTEGWQVSRNSDFSSYTSLASAALADASTAATYLTSRYYSYYWRKVAA